MLRVAELVRDILPAGILNVVTGGDNEHQKHCRSAQPMSLMGQNLRLPQRNIDSRLTSVSRHYASEAVQPFVAPSMSSLDSDFVLRAIQGPNYLGRVDSLCLSFLVRGGLECCHAASRALNLPTERSMVNLTSDCLDASHKRHKSNMAAKS